MTSQVHPTIQNAAERSFWKIRRFTAEKLDPIGLRSCFNHLNRMQAMSIRTKNLANLKVTDTSETFLKTSTKFLWARHDPESFLDGQTWNTFNSHCTSTDYRREWSSSLNECRQSWMRPIPVGIWQVKRYGYIYASQVCSTTSHMRQNSKNFFMFWNAVASWKILQRRTTCAWKWHVTWQNRCTSPSSDLVIVRSVITRFTRSATWCSYLKVPTNTNVTCTALCTCRWKNRGPSTYLPFTHEMGHLLMKLKTRILDERTWGCGSDRRHANRRNNILFIRADTLHMQAYSLQPLALASWRHQEIWQPWQSHCNDKPECYVDVTFLQPCYVCEVWSTCTVNGLGRCEREKERQNLQQPNRLIVVGTTSKHVPQSDEEPHWPHQC